MGEQHLSPDITKQVLQKQAATLNHIQASTSVSGDGVGISEEDIQSIRSLITTLLDGAKKVIISNKGQRKSDDDPMVALKVNTRGFRLLLTRNMKRWDYIFDLEKNQLLLNKFPATHVDADRFKQFFNGIISRMVDDSYDVIKDG